MNDECMNFCLHTVIATVYGFCLVRSKVLKQLILLWCCRFKPVEVTKFGARGLIKTMELKTLEIVYIIT